jgi:hypothetical protein
MVNLQRYLVEVTITPVNILFDIFSLVGQFFFNPTIVDFPLVSGT